MALVANKSDLYDSQEVEKEEGQETAKKYGIKFLSTSALNDRKRFQEFVNELIEKYIEKYIETEKNVNNSPNKNIIINNKTNQDKNNKKKCC